MDSNRLIILKIRQSENLTLKQAADKLGVSVGWLSGVEREKGRVKFDKKRFEELVTLYNGWKYKPKFGTWVRKSQLEQETDSSMYGSIFKHYRIKANLTQAQAAKLLGISSGYLSMVENEKQVFSEEKWKKALHIYNVTHSHVLKCANVNDKRSMRIPSIYKLQSIIKKLDKDSILKVYNYAKSLAV